MKTIVFTTLLLSGFLAGWNEQEKFECQTWHADVVEHNFTDFSHWQIEQCAAHGVTLPIK